MPASAEGPGSTSSTSSTGAAGGLDPEDAKLVTLARSAMARGRTTSGAAVRDAIGRTYAAGGVELPSLRLTALQAAVAAAVSSGADGLEAAVVVGGDSTLLDDDRSLLDDVGATTVLLVAPDGSVSG